MNLSFEPQELAELRLRYPRAVDHFHYHPHTVAGREPNPAEEREHNFDFFDGTRLIVSLERSAQGQFFVMVSAWRDPGSFLSGQAAPPSQRSRTIEAQEAYRSISRDNREMNFLGYDPGPIWAIGPVPCPVREEDLSMSSMPDRR